MYLLSQPLGPLHLCEAILLSALDSLKRTALS
jgi:hypothetical protein